ncbi:SCAN domain-containing protein 3-like [Kogia breviceps]|uniref:SCAN domain-containing protein 3-like n=1 Tax=Kogia breviceps TaxID=27615 RepID=UPI0034D1A859
MRLLFVATICCLRNLNIVFSAKKKGDVHEDMLCALLLPTNTAAAELFKSLNDYIPGKLNWSFSVGICTDRVAAMTGRLSGFITWVKEVASECESTHCVIHREMLAS